MKFICIVGKKRSGKDTIADFILSEKGGVKCSLADTFKHVLNQAYKKLELSNHSGTYLSIDHFYGFVNTERTIEYDRESQLHLSQKNVIDLFHSAVEILKSEYGLKYVNDNPLSETFKTIPQVVSKKKDQKWCLRTLMQTFGTDIIVDIYDKQFWNKKMLDMYMDNLDNDGYFIVPDIRQEHEIKLMRNLNAEIIFTERPDINNDTDSHISEKGLIPFSNETVIINDGTLTDLKTKVLEALK